MTVLNPTYAKQIVPQRDNGSEGNPNWVNLPEVLAVVDLGPAQLINGTGARFVQNGVAFFPRGSDIEHGDRIPHNGRNYTIVGDARGDQDHPITGENFGWVEYTVTGGNAVELRDAVSEHVIRHRGGGRDEDGRLTPSVDVPLLAIEIVPGGGSEFVERSRDGERTACTVRFPPGTDIVNSDELTVRGERFSIVVNDWRSAAGAIEVLCTRGQG